MRVDKEYQDDVLILRPYGRIDTLSAGEFQEKLFDALDEDSNIMIDLKETEYISSSGLRVFLSAKKKVGDRIMLSLTNVKQNILEIFEMTGVSNFLHIIEDDEELHGDIKVIFFDIDGTLLSHKTGKVPQSTIDAIRKLQDKGIKVVVATGRDINEMKKLPLDEIDFDGYLTLNGNICLDKDEKMFAGNEIDPGEVEILVGIFGAGKIPFVLIGEEKRYINYVDDVVIQTQEATHGTIPDIGEYNGEKIYQCLAFVNAETRQKLEDLLDHCSITSWNDTGIDIIAKTGGKAAGIQKFLDKEGITRSQTMAFGDGENDKTMIKFAGTGVAMGNAGDNLKRAADYVTADIDDDGIAKALIHFGLIEE
ncbi:MAG: Cof-type HAD-IIB family hydrolase [Erysipelotrichaceae bacterium]|nr:Cof-type HAD-IIB family hydrolase [Erysipelotrichaceae bacterium]